ncbi:hypothetical protein F2K52_19815 [Salmonella enterica subsp. enterica]|nr:hypothetical protein [Salmonella enterica subsp. enterica]
MRLNIIAGGLITEDVLILFGDSIIGDTINLVKSIKEENLYKLIETNQTLLSLNYEVLKNMLRGS